MSVCPESKNTSLSAASSTNSGLVARAAPLGAAAGGGEPGAPTTGAGRDGGGGVGASGAAEIAGGGLGGAALRVGAVCSAHPASVTTSNAVHRSHPRWVLMALPSFGPLAPAWRLALGVDVTGTDKR